MHIYCSKNIQNMFIQKINLVEYMLFWFLNSSFTFVDRFSAEPETNMVKTDLGAVFFFSNA